MANVPTDKQDPGLLQRDAVLAAEFRAIYGEEAPSVVLQTDVMPEATAETKPEAKSDPKPDATVDPKPDAEGVPKPEPQADPAQDFMPPPDEVTLREAAAARRVLR